jgi:hypothetical protein
MSFSSIVKKIVQNFRFTLSLCRSSRKCDQKCKEISPIGKRSSARLLHVKKKVESK